jgi:dethiobiotin synthetase
MISRLVLVSGTGTGIGKTHFCEALLLALCGRGLRVAGIKPVETGFTGPGPSDAARLAKASSFHVKHSGVRFAAPVSPHLAAREAGAPISLQALRDEVAAISPAPEVLLAELAGGLFSPLTETETNADLAAILGPAVHLLVAPDRLGVLHDVIAATRAAASIPLPIHGIVLVAPEAADPSSGRNGAELARIQRIPVLATLPRAPAPELAATPAISAVARVVAS